MIALDDVNALITAVDSGSLSAAATRLGLSKQAVSRRIVTLEAQLGARLLVRTTRRLSLTADGEAFVERGRRILADMEAAVDALAHPGHPRGQLRLTAPATFGTMYLIHALPRFLAAYPEIELDLHLTDRTVDLVGEAFDLALRIGALADSTLVARKLAPVRPVVCASPDYLRRRGTPQIPDDLRQHDCLQRRQRGVTLWHFQQDGRPCTVPVTGRLRGNNGEAAREAAIAGFGLVWLPDFMVCDAVRDGRLVRVLNRFMPDNRALVALTPHHRQVPASVRAFIDFARATFGPTPSWALD